MTNKQPTKQPIEAVTTTLIKELLLKFPETPSNTLAKKFVKDNPKFLLTAEQARLIIRRLRGAQGDKSRATHVDFRKELAALKKDLPKGETDYILPYHIPKRIRKILLLSDIHIPYQDDTALYAALEYGHNKQVDCIYLNGDTMDIHSLSRHERDPRKKDWLEERDNTRSFLRRLRSMFPDALIVFKIGNHDERYEKWIMQNSSIIYDEQYMGLAAVLNFAELGIIEVKSKQFAYAGKLPILHGHELPMKSGGDNPANLSKKRMGKQAIFGHFHKTTQANGREFDKGMSYAIYSTGCLCDLHPNYMPINEWNHGFAYIEVDKDGNYVVENKTILNGKIF